MTRAHANGIDIEYEITGSGEPLLLLMGLGGQLTDWHPGLVELLAEQFTVIRFDNRDIGLSTYSDAPVPSRWQLIKANLFPRFASAPYLLADMAEDAAGLLQALDIESAHVAGMSMGGMIAQELATRHPQRVRSLCSIMSTTGDRRVGRPKLRALLSLARRSDPNPQPEDVVELTVDMFRIVGGRDWDEAEQRRRTTISLARSYNPAGMMRQSLAIAKSPDRTDALGTVTQPTLVVHGLDDTLVQPSGGIATARAVSNSRLLMLPRMGHDLPATRHHEIVAAIARNAARATALGAERTVADLASPPAVVV